MKKVFSVLLLVVFSFGIISCSNEDPSGANSQLDQVLDQPNSTDDRVNIDLPDLTLDSCYLMDNSTIDNSTIEESAILDNSSIKDSIVRNCSTVSNSVVDNSTIDNSKVCDSNIDNSTIEDSTVGYLDGTCSDNVSFSFVDETIRNRTITEQTDPTVSSVAITSSTENTYSRLNAGDNVSVTATFSESVFVTDDDGIGVDNASGTPTLTIAVGSDNRTATYVSGSTSNALVFQYTIQSGDNDTNGISIYNDSLALNSGTIRDASGNYATITHSSADNNTSYMVDNTAPSVLSVAPTSSTSTSAISQFKLPATGGSVGSLCDGNCYIYITATWSENVILTDYLGGADSVLTLVVGDGGEAVSRTAVLSSYWISGSGGYVRYRYAIQENDPLDTDGIFIGANAITLNYDIITDLAGNVAPVTHLQYGTGEDNNYQVKNW